MIDPSNITNFNRTKPELEEFFLFSVCVGGKTANTIVKKINDLINLLPNKDYILDSLISKPNAIEWFKEVRMGNYSKIEQFIDDLSWKKINLRTSLPQHLEELHGVGPKTSRFFIVHSRPNQQYAVLDTHILKWLRSLGYDVPKATPTCKKYLQVEQLFLEECRKRWKTPAELDLEVWRHYNERRSGN